jgi:uncharacterized delta-60 repeat protein
MHTKNVRSGNVALSLYFGAVTAALGARRASGIARLAIAAAAAAAVSPALAAPGDLDATFGSNGFVWIDVAGETDHARTVVAQRDGKLLVGRGNERDLSVVRLGTDGALDTSFGVGGVASLGVPNQTIDTAAIVEQADGNVIVVGTANNDLAVARFLTDGRVDTSFGSNGLTLASFGLAMLATTVVQQDDGKLVIGGAVLSGMRRDAFLTRFDTAGAVDASFGVGGAAIYSSALAERVTALAQQTDGKLVAAVRADPGAMAVLRLTRDGALDPSFDGDGKALIEVAGIYSLATAVAVQTDGKIVIGGDGYGVGAVARLNPDGSPDSSFGSGGSMSFNVAATTGIGIVNGSLIIEPSGAILVGGDQWRWGEDTWAGDWDFPLDGFLARLTPSGALDPSFGQAGVTIIDVGDHAASSWNAMQGIARLPDGSLAAAMTTSLGAPRIALVRLAAASNNPGRIGLLFNDHHAQEGSAAPFTVRRTGGSAGVVSVDYSTETRPFVWPNVLWPYLAESGVDFTSTAGTLTWPDGDVSYREIIVPVARDAVVEPEEAFALTLSNPSVGASLAMTVSRTFIIGDPAFEQPPPTPPGGGGGAVGILDALMLVSLLLLSTANCRVSRPW